MKKLHVVRRGFNSRRPFRKLNSVTELVGKEVEVQDADQLIQSEVEDVSVDKAGDATLTLSTGDEVILDSAEADELIETGDVVAEEDAPKVPDEFEVTREVVDADGNTNEVTTTVEAENEGEALQQVTLLDSRRKRNSRNYRARNKNSEIEEPVTEDPDDSNKEPETKEFKVTRVADCDGKKVRKTASVTAPTIDEAIDAVKAADAKNEIKADGYEELVEKEPTSTVTINSDVDEVIEEPEVKSEDPDKDPDEDPVRNPAVQTEDPDKDPEDKLEDDIESDRESNSFKGVSAFVKRKYGVDL